MFITPPHNTGPKLRRSGMKTTRTYQIVMACPTPSYRLISAIAP